jgi:hypothetical protein
MSTHSFIGIENDDGTVNFVFCCFDGYPTGVGADLVGMDRDKARKLVAKGDMRCVGEPFEPRTPIMVAASRIAYDDAFRSGHCDYAYLIDKNGAWKFTGGGVQGWYSLKQELRAAKKRV